MKVKSNLYVSDCALMNIDWTPAARGGVLRGGGGTERRWY